MRTLSSITARCLAGLLFAVMLSVATTREATAQTPSLNEAVVEVVVNDQETAETLVVLRDDTNNFWLEESDLTRLRLKLPKVTPQLYEGRRYYSLSAIKAQSQFDEAKQRLVLMA